MKNKIKKITYTVSGLFASIFMNLLIFSPVYAQKISFPNPIGSTDLKQLVEKFLKVVVEFGAIVAVFFLIYAGFLFVKAQGNDSELQKAKQTFFWTVVGGMVILGAHVLSRVIQNTVKEISG